MDLWSVVGQELLSIDVNLSGINAEFRTAMLSAVHSEFHTVSQRAMNVVVSGLPIKSNISDANQFSGLCETYFFFQPKDPVNTSIRVTCSHQQQTSNISYHSHGCYVHHPIR